MRFKKILLLFFVFSEFSAYLQNEPESSFSVFSVGDPNSHKDTCLINSTFYTSSKNLLRDSMHIFAIEKKDTLRFVTDASGKATFVLSPGIYDLIIFSALTDTLFIPQFEIEKFKNYVFDFYLKTIVFRIPEIRYDLGKPVIYCYTDQYIPAVTINIETYGKLKFTYPEDQNGWNFSLNANGEINLGNQTYPYLFWDAQFDHIPDYFESGKGFCIHRDSLLSFFDSTLNVIGFNSREKTDFITFWCPKMMTLEYVKIHFLFDENCNELALLNIHPTPDELFRMYMIWESVETFESLIPQEIPVINRSGFTVVEWGGMRTNRVLFGEKP